MVVAYVVRGTANRKRHPIARRLRMSTPEIAMSDRWTVHINRVESAGLALGQWSDSLETDEQAVSSDGTWRAASCMQPIGSDMSLQGLWS